MNGTIDDQIMHSLLKVLSQLIPIVANERHCPQGIDLMDICNEYYSLYGQRLDPHVWKDSHRVTTIYELCQRLSEECDQSLVVVDQSNRLFKSDRLFFDEKAYHKWIQSFKRQSDVHVLEMLVKHRMPSDVPSQLDKQIPLCDEPIKAMNECRISSLRAKVIHVETPTLMYIHLKSRDQSYRELRQGLRFYDGDDHQNRDYMLPKELALKGYLCAVRNPLDWDNWHRARIIHVLDNSVTLFAIDFGNFITETIGELRLLRAEFFSYPIQAIKVSLSGIAPFAMKWSDGAIDFMKKFVRKYKSEYNLGCVFIDQLPDDYYSVILHQMVSVDVEGTPQMMPIYLHEKLILSGFAQMISTCWTQIEFTIHSSVPYEAIEEPLLAIKCEADFGAYESPTVFDKQTNVNENGIHESSPEPHESSPEPLFEDNIEPKRSSLDEFRSESSSQSSAEVPKVKEEVVDYKELFFTSYESPELKIKSYLSSYDSFPFIQCKYYIDGTAFPYYRRKYMTETESIDVQQLRYMKEYPTVPRKYMVSDDSSDTENSYLLNTDNTVVTNKYYNYQN